LGTFFFIVSGLVAVTGVFVRGIFQFLGVLLKGLFSETELKVYVLGCLYRELVSPTACLRGIVSPTAAMKYLAVVTVSHWDFIGHVPPPIFRFTFVIHFPLRLFRVPRLPSQPLKVLFSDENQAVRRTSSQENQAVRRSR
jgi:hypothetical protein